MTPEERTTWLSRRRQNVGASEAGALLGVSPWRTRYELWHLKAGLLEEEDLSDNQRVFWGQTLEPAVALGVAQEKGWTVHKVHRYIEHPAVTGMAASLDYEVVGHASGAGVLEIKTCDYLQWKEWGKDLPLVYEVQLQHQLAVTRRTWGAVGVLVGGNDLHVFERERHDGAIERLEYEVQVFWESIRKKEPPPIDWERDADSVVALCQTATPGKVLRFEEQSEIEGLFWGYHHASEQEALHAANKKVLKAKILQTIGDAQKAVCGPYVVNAGMVSGGRVEAYDRQPFRAFRLTKKIE